MSVKRRLNASTCLAAASLVLFPGIAHAQDRVGARSGTLPLIESSVTTTPAPATLGTPRVVAPRTGLDPSRAASDAHLVAHEPFDLARALAGTRVAQVPAFDELDERLLALQATTPVDDSALRFYAASGDLVRVEAEIARLRARHPGWTVPADLYEPLPETSPEQAIWDLFGEGRFADARAELRRIIASDLRWSPSAAFVETSRVYIAYQAVLEAGAMGDHARVLAIGLRVPEALVCANMDFLWHTGEALAKAVDETRALSLYTYVLSRCDDPQERFATAQKASRILSTENLARAFSYQRPQADGRHEFEDVLYGLLLERVGTAAATNDGRVVVAEDLMRLEEWASARRDTKGAELRGWYAYVVERDFVVSERWFRQALVWGDNPAAVEGLIVSLRQLGRDDEAETLAFTYFERGEIFRFLYITIVAERLTRPDVLSFPADRLARYAALVEAQRSLEGIQALGWFSYKTEDFAQARRWFELAVSIDPSESNLHGLALALHELGAREPLEALALEHGTRIARIAEVAAWGRPALQASAPVRQPRQGPDRASGAARTAIEHYEAGRWRQAVEAIDAAGSALARDHGIQVLRGWALLNAGRGEEAYRQFQHADRMRRTTDTVYGMHWTMERMFGSTDSAIGFIQADSFRQRMLREEATTRQR